MCYSFICNEKKTLSPSYVSHREGHWKRDFISVTEKNSSALLLQITCDTRNVAKIFVQNNPNQQLRKKNNIQNSIKILNDSLCQTRIECQNLRSARMVLYIMSDINSLGNKWGFISSTTFGPWICGQNVASKCRDQIIFHKNAITTWTITKISKCTRPPHMFLLQKSPYSLWSFFYITFHVQVIPCKIKGLMFFQRNKFKLLC
jgi:hypothetical protein